MSYSFWLRGRKAEYIGRALAYYADWDFAQVELWALKELYGISGPCIVGGEDE